MVGTSILNFYADCNNDWYQNCGLRCRHGGWIIDGFPVNKDQWSLLAEQGKNLPDHVIFLQDESPNGDLLIKRWYMANQADTSGQIERYHRSTVSSTKSLVNLLFCCLYLCHEISCVVARHTHD